MQAVQTPIRELSIEPVRVLTAPDSPDFINSPDSPNLERDGLRCSFDFELDYPLEKFWSVITDWNNGSWVAGVVSVDILETKFTKPNRQLNMANGAYIKEVLLDVDETTHTLSYFVYETTAMPVTMYKGTMKLFPDSVEGKTKATYENVFVTKEGVDAEKFKAGMEKGFKERSIPYMQKTFKQ